MAGRVVPFPRLDTAQAAQFIDDPNLSKLFTADELYSAWDKLEMAALEQVTELVRSHSENGEAANKSLSDQSIKQLAALFLRRASERARVRPLARSLLSKPRP